VAEAATKPLDEAAFKLEFQLVGKQLGDYEAKHGADATAELWTTYRRIRYGDAVSTQGKRDAAAAILRQIQHDMR
jgi:hypothetical protein